MDVRSYQIRRVCFLCVDGIPGFARSCSRKEPFFGTIGLANPIFRLNPSYWIQEQPVWLVKKKVGV